MTTIAGIVDNTGAININGGDQLLVGDAADPSGATLEGAGTVDLAGSTSVDAGVAGAVLTNVDNTIQGAGGNDAGYNQNDLNVTLVNETNGVVQANGALNYGQADLFINAGVTNDGTLAAVNGGYLYLENVTIDDVGGGVVETEGANSEVVVNGATIQGGSIETSGGGVSVNSGLFDGSGGNAVTVDANVAINSTLSLAGAIINQGSITLNFGGANLAIGDASDADATLSGKGQIFLDGAAVISAGVAGAVLTNVDDTIEGVGGTDAGYNQNGFNVALVNEANGVVEANAATNGQADLYINAGVTNDGTLAAINGGYLYLSAITVDDSGGGVVDAAGGGSQVVLNGVVVEGGLLETSAGGVIGSNSGTLDGVGKAVTNTGDVQVNTTSTLTLEGAIDNSGEITFGPPNDAYGNSLLIGGPAGSAVSLTGHGHVIMTSDSQIASGLGGAVLTNVDDTIEGLSGYEHNGGNGGDINVALVNDAGGLVEAIGQGNDVGALNIYGNVTNYGTLAAITGGSLWIYSNIDNQGTLSANAATLIDNGSITGPGVIDISGGGEFLLNSSTGENVEFTGTGGTLDLANTAGFGGTITAAGASNVVDLPNLQLPSSPIGNPPDYNDSPDHGIWTESAYLPPYLKLAYSGNSSGGVVSVVLYENWTLFDQYNNGISSQYIADGTLFSMQVSGDYNLSSFTLTQVQGAGYEISIQPIPSFSWKTAVSGAWTTAADWNPSGPPSTGSDAAINVAGTYTVIEWQNTTLNALSIGDSGATLAITGGDLQLLNGTGLGANAGTIAVDGDATLEIGGTFLNHGSVVLTSGGSYPTLDIDDAANLTGAGSIVLDSAGGGFAQILGNATNDGALTNLGNTIEGFGQIGGGNGKLTFDNSAGTVDANSSGDDLTILTGNTVANSARLEATSGGTLNIDDPVANAGGVIEALDLAVVTTTVNVNGAVTGGHVEASGGGLVNIKGNVTNAAIEAITGGSIDVTLATLSDDTISVTGAGSSLTLGYPSVVAGGALTSGSGDVISSEGGTLDGATTTVTLSAGSNLRIVDGYSLVVEGTLKDAGAIEVGDSASAVWTEFYASGPVSLTGGGKILLTANGGSGSWIFGQGSGPDTLTNNGDAILGAGGIGQDNGNLTLDNASGVIDADVAGAGLGINTGNIVTNTATLEATSGGVLSLYDGVSNTGGKIEALSGGAMNVYQPVTDGLVEASGAGSFVNIRAGVSDAMIQAASDGAVDIQSTTLTGDTISVTGAGSSLTLDYQAVVSGGTLTSSSGEVVKSSGGSLDGSTATVTLTAGSTLVIADGTATDVEGTLDNIGAIQVGDAASTSWTELNVGGPVSLTGGGKILLTAAAGNGSWIFGQGSDAGALTNNGDTIQGSGGISSNESKDLSFDNATGVVDADVAGADLAISTSNLVTNTATLEATGGGVLELYDSTTNTGGTIAAFTGSTVDVNAPLTGGVLEASGAGSAVDITSGVTSAKIEASGGGAITVSQATLTNDTTGVSGAGSSLTLGYLAVVAGGSLTANASDSIDANDATLDGASSTVTLTAGSVIQIPDSDTLYLTGTIDNAGVIDIGDAASMSWTSLQISGAATLEGSGSVELTAASSGYGWIWGNSSDFGTLTNKGDAIEGAGGVGYGGNGELTFDNIGGVVDANVAGASIVIDTGNAVTNKATLKATNDGKLSIDDSVTNSGGRIEALAGGAVSLYGIVTGGTLLANDGSGASLSLDGATVEAATIEGAANDAIETASNTMDTLNGVTIGSGGTVTDTAGATLDLAGSNVNDGMIEVFNATLDLKGSLGGIGAIDLDNSAQFDIQGSVGSGQTLVFNADSTPVSLSDASGFAGVLSGFGTGNAIDLVGFDANATLAYSGNAMNGVLTITDGSKKAKIALDGDYVLGGFVLTPSSDGETLTYATPPSVAVSSVSAVIGATGSSGTAVSFSGVDSTTASPVESVAIYNGAVNSADFLGDATLGAGGTWSFSGTLAAGTYNALEAVATTQAGSTATALAPFTVRTGVTTAPYSAVQTTTSLGETTSKTEYNADGSTYLSETWQYNTDGSYQIVFSDVTGEPYNSYTESFGPNGKPISETFSNGNSETWSPPEADGSYDIVFAGPAGADVPSYTEYFGTNGEPTRLVYTDGETGTWSPTESDGSYSIVYTDVPSSKYYNTYTVDYGPNGKEDSILYGDGETVSVTPPNPDGSYSIVYSGVKGAAYTGETIQYNARGEPTSAHYNNNETATWSYNLNGTIAEVAYGGITGQAYTSYEVFYGANGNPATATYFVGAQQTTQETWTYNPNGTLYETAYTDVPSEPYTSYQVFYGPNGGATSATYSNGMTETWTYASDGLLEQVVDQHVTGQSYTALADNFDSSGLLATSLTTNTNGTYTLDAYESGLTLDATETGETLSGNGNGGETFLFPSSFGRDTLADFASHLSGAGADTLSLPGAPFGNLFSNLLAATTFNAAGATIKLDANDTVAIPKLTEALMQANVSDFAFHS
jgi:hypothetical protein